MSFDIFAEPMVISSKDARPRRGRGFTRGEIKEVGLTVQEARNMGLIVDLRRKSAYSENVDILKQYLIEMEEFIKHIMESEEAAVAPSSTVSDLASLKGVKKADAEALFSAGIKSIEDLAYCEMDKVAKKSGIDEERLMAMVKAALAKV
jgi:replicative superfamily II helicase